MAIDARVMVVRGRSSTIRQKDPAGSYDYLLYMQVRKARARVTAQQEALRTLLARPPLPLDSFDEHSRDEMTVCYSQA